MAKKKDVFNLGYMNKSTKKWVPVSYDFIFQVGEREGVRGVRTVEDN